LAAGLAPATLDLATRLAAARPVISIIAWQASAPVPSARLPMCSVRFFSRSSLLHARCDCKKGSACEHVALAVWAFRQASLGPGQLQAMLELAPPMEREGATLQRFFDPHTASPAPDLDALLLQLWLDGSSQAPVAIEARFEAVRSRCAALGWCWVVESIDEIRHMLAAQNARSSSFDPARLLDALAECPARLIAARHAERLAVGQTQAPVPAAQILGIGVKGEVALDHLRLVSLGVECWQDDQTEGVRIAFADPDTQTVTVLVRDWLKASGTATSGLMARRIAGQSVSKLACGQVVTKGARRRANGLIDIATGARQTSVLPLSPQSWNTLDAPLRQPSGRILAAYLRDAHPDFVRPRQAIEHLHVLPVTRVLEWGWDAATQILHARVLGASSGEQGNVIDEADVVQLSLPHQAVAPGAVDAMARVLLGEWGEATAVAGVAWIEAGRLHMRPLSMLTTQRPVVLQAEQAAPRSLPLGAIHSRSVALTGLIGNTREMLVSWLRQGLRHQGAGSLARGNVQADLLTQAGLHNAGAALRNIIDELRSDERKSLPTHLLQLILLLNGIQHAIPTVSESVQAMA
jgi:hypothetical protein